MKLFVAMAVPNFSNARMHWRKRAKVVAEQRDEVTAALCCYEGVYLPRASAERPWLVKLTRQGHREMDDDGVVSALKPTRDAIAAFVGVDDRHRHIVRYVYEQRVVKRCEPMGVEIEVQEAEQWPSE